MWRSLAALAACAALLAGCAPASKGPESAEPSVSPSTPVTAGTPDAPAPGAGETIVRFSNDVAHVDVVMGEETPAVRDFLTMLPLEITLEDFNQKEKLSYLPRELAWSGSPGSDPEDGDLIYFTPWGNIGFYYDASGIGYSDSTLHLGTYTASRAVLDALDGAVTVEIRMP